MMEAGNNIIQPTFLSGITEICFYEPYKDCDYNLVVPCDKSTLYKTMVSLVSLKEKCGGDEKIEILILYDGIDYYEIEAIKHIFAKCNNLHIRFCRVAHDFSKGYFRLGHEYSKAKIIEYFAPLILKKYVNVITVHPGTLFEKNSICNITKAHKNNGVAVITTEKGFYCSYNIPDYIQGHTVKDVLANMKDCVIGNQKLCEDNDDNSEEYNYFLKQIPLYEAYKMSVALVDNNDKNVLKKPMNPRIYLFPFEAVSKDSKVIIYGYGLVGKQFEKQISKSHFCRLISILDKNKFDGNMVLNPECIRELDYDLIIIAVASSEVAQKIKTELISLGVQEDKILYCCDREIT